MDVAKLVKHVEDLVERSLNNLDGKDATGVWSETTRVGGSQVKSVSRTDLEFLIDAAESSDVPVVQRYAARLRKKYLGE